MGFSEAVKTCLGKYADFSGRARRSEYWWFFLFQVIVSFLGGLFDGVLGTSFASIVATLALLLPNLSVTVRRLHDVDRPGFWLLLPFVATAAFFFAVHYGVGVVSIVLGLVAIAINLMFLYLMINKGTERANRHGPVPA